MATQVIKRDGTKEVFDENKIRKSIEMAVKGAALTEDRINAVVAQVVGLVLQFAAEKEEIATTEIRDFILTQLDQVEPVVAESWRKYNQEEGKV